MWEKEKIVVTIIFCLPHNIFYSFQNKFKFLGYIYFVSENAFTFDQCKILLFDEGLRPL